MSKDIREAHMEFARELLKMYDDENEFEELKERYLKIAKGGIPEEVEEIKIEETQIGICDLLTKIKFAQSKSEAKRMITGKGVKINSETVTDINLNVEIGNGKIVQFGKNKIKKIIN